MCGKDDKGVVRIQIENFETLNSWSEGNHVKIGNVEWKLGAYTTSSAETNNVKHLSLKLLCKSGSRSNLWSVNASVKLCLVKLNSNDPKEATSLELEKKFDGKSKELDVKNFINWEEANCYDNRYIVDKHAVVEAHIVVKDLVGIHEKILEDFSEPNGELTDMVLVVEGKKVYVGRQILARASKFFRALFYSDFSENSKKEIPVEDVVHSEFINFLNVVYSTHKAIDTANVGHLLKLADRFGADAVIEKCESFLITCQNVHLVDKFQYAETYRLSELQDNCLSLLTTSTQVRDMSKHANYENLGDVTYNVILHKLTDLLG